MEASTVTVALCLMLLIIETKSSFLTVPVQAKICSPFLIGNGNKIIGNYYMNPVSQDTESKDVDNLQDNPLSDIDARVLRSLLEDKNLDLNSEDNLRKILEKGSTPKKSPVRNVKESEFSSTFFQTLTDTSLWKSVKVKFDEVIESASIYVQNRVERDAKLLAAIGMFAFQRALRDSERVLPASGKSGAKMAETMRKALFQLSTNSSFAEYIPKDNFVLPPSKYSVGVQTQNYEELNTPMDEIRSVTKSIKDILSGKTISDNRGLRSLAAANAGRNAERQQKAYERRKETLLQREKEGLDRKVVRATSSVSDAAWELKREMEFEGNEAGYRAKMVQRRLEGTLESLGLPESTLFRGIGNRIFGSKEKDFMKPLSQLKSAFDDDKLTDRDISNDFFPEPVFVTLDELEDERDRLIDSFNYCLSAPGETWLTPVTMADYQDSNAQRQISVGDLEKVITMMVLNRNNLESLSDRETSRSQDEILQDLTYMKTMVDQIFNLAAASAGLKASEALKDLLLGVGSEEERSLLTMVEEIQFSLESHKTALQEFLNRKSSAKEVYAKRDGADSNYTERDLFFIDEVEGSIGNEAFQSTDLLTPDTLERNVNSSSLNGERNRILSDAEIISSSQLFVNNVNTIDSIEDDDDETVRYSNVEVLTDEDISFEDDLFMSAARDENISDNENRELSPMITLSLRAIDIILFVVEKTITVGLPGVVEAANRVVKRRDEVNRNGLGTKGWRWLDNLCSPKKRY